MLLALNQHSIVQFGCPVTRSNGPLDAAGTVRYCDDPLKETLPEDILDPNAIERVAVLFELKIPVDNVTPLPSIKLPAANVYVLVAVNAYDLLNVTVPAFCVNAAVALNVQLKGLPP